MFSFKDFFNIRKGIAKVFNPVNTARVLKFAVDKIVEYVNRNDLMGVEKKVEVDEAVQKYIIDHIFKDLMSNKYLNPLFTALLYSVIPMVTQTLYDCLKAFIRNLTKKLDDKLAETEPKEEGEA